MSHVYSYTWLCEKMADRGRVAIRTFINGNEIILRGLINGIRPEDGSGRNWLVTIHDNDTNAEVFIRTA
jgi:hypothetical protein